MAWALLDDNFPHNPKVAHANSLHALAGYLFVCGLCYCRKYRTSGFIPETALKALGFFTAPKKPSEALIASRLWDKVDGGYQVHGYLEQYDDAEEVKAKDERRRQKQEAGRAGGKASWLKRKGVSASSTAEAPAMGSAEPLAEPHRFGLVEAPVSSVLVLQEKKEIGPRDAWWLELLRRYPANRRRDSRIVQGEFNDIFNKDPRPDAVIWVEIVEGLENALQGYEWRVKGMVPAMDRWLERKGWTERHEYAPVSSLVSEKTARNLTAMEQFIKAGER